MAANYPPEKALREALPLAASLRRHPNDPGARPLGYKIQGFRLWLTERGDVTAVTTESGAVWLLVNHEEPTRAGERHLNGVTVETSGRAKKPLAVLYRQGIDPQPPAEIMLHEPMSFGGWMIGGGVAQTTSPVTSITLNGVRVL